METESDTGAVVALADHRAKRAKRANLTDGGFPPPAAPALPMPMRVEAA